jgi:hypothetical protein
MSVAGKSFAGKSFACIGRRKIALLPFRHTPRRNPSRRTFIFCRCVRDAMD